MSLESKKIVDGIIEFEQGVDPKPKMEVLPPKPNWPNRGGGLRQRGWGPPTRPITKTIWQQLKELQPNTNKTKLVALADKIIEMAINGDVRCIQLVMNRIDGLQLLNFGAVNQEPSLEEEISATSNGTELDTLRLVVKRARARAVDSGGTGSVPGAAPEAGVQDHPAGGVSEPRSGEAKAEIQQSEPGGAATTSI